MESIAVIAGLPWPISHRALDRPCPVSEACAKPGFFFHLGSTERAAILARAIPFAPQFAQALVVVSQCFRHRSVDGEGASAVDQLRTSSRVARTSASRFRVNEGGRRLR